MKRNMLQIRIESELSELIDYAVQNTGLTKSELLRQGLRKGVPEVVRALGTPRRKTLVNALFDMKGLDLSHRRSRMKRRI